MHKIININAFPPEILMIKESRNLLDKNILGL